MKELKDEVVSLRQRVLNMEQLENEVAELQQELSEVKELKSKLVDKLMESEKVYDEEVEKLRSLGGNSIAHLKLKLTFQSCKSMKIVART